MSAHTDGPWVSNSDGSAIKAGDKTIADCIPEHPRDRVPREQFLPNARLIAAAPDMLAALQVMVNDSMFKDHPEASQMALDAIAKATTP